MKKPLAFASLAAIAAATVVGLIWLWLFIAAYHSGRYDLPFLVTQLDQFLVSSIAGAATFAIVLWLSGRRRRVPQGSSIGAAFGSAVLVAGGLGFLWAGLWIWMARYYSPTHTRIDIDIPWLSLSWETLPYELAIVLPVAFVIFGLALLATRQAAP